jgi:uroporphyrinogen decarboxylase
MKSRERVLSALNHEQPDRVPFFYRDVPEVSERLIRDLGLKNREDLLRFLDIDFRWIEPRYIGPPLHDPECDMRRDIWGVSYKYVRFNEADGYWEPIERPLLDCHDPEQLEDYPWPKLAWFDFSQVQQDVLAYADYALMTAPNYSSPGIFQCPIQTLIGEERSFTDLALDPEFIHALVRHALDFQIPFIERLFSAAKGKIDFFRIGDDFGTQRGLLMSRDMWRTFFREPLRQMADTARAHGAYYYQHSCGAIREMIPDFIDIGVDVLDPIQVKAQGMIPSELKAEFGDRLCFSGGVDEQELLPNGTAQEIRQAVFALLDDMAIGGGFFLGPTHNFQADIPTDNIVAMYEAAREWSPK